MNPFVQKNQMFYIYKQIVLWILLNYLKYILNLLLPLFKVGLWTGFRNVQSPLVAHLKQLKQSLYKLTKVCAN